MGTSRYFVALRWHVGLWGNNGHQEALAAGQGRSRMTHTGSLAECLGRSFALLL